MELPSPFLTSHKHGLDVALLEPRETPQPGGSEPRTCLLPPPGSQCSHHHPLTIPLRQLQGWKNQPASPCFSPQMASLSSHLEDPRIGTRAIPGGYRKALDVRFLCSLQKAERLHYEEEMIFKIFPLWVGLGGSVHP